MNHWLFIILWTADVVDDRWTIVDNHIFVPMIHIPAMKLRLIYVNMNILYGPKVFILYHYLVWHMNIYELL